MFQIGQVVEPIDNPRGIRGVVVGPCGNYICCRFGTEASMWKPEALRHHLSDGKPILEYQLRNQAQGVAIQWFQGKEPVPPEATETAQRWCRQFGGCSEVVIAAYAHHWAGL